jgi:hypothetical protein
VYLFLFLLLLFFFHVLLLPILPLLERLHSLH